ncbi:hypothetical protein [Belnapia sp. F-4-1]|uniref:hypothetical protein n=1 Tax=Belnapia sp. F-4-1 TaxID=1545443 RepID=UPI0005B84E7C|nr:hypothetical protein [Belnapia sp. F-4-1]
MLNASLSIADFYKLRKSDQGGFAKWRIETLPKGMLLFKLTKGEAEEGQYGVTAWWSAVKPFKEDYEGALGRYQQAKLNGIDMSAMVRFMSAVRIDWNDLDNYVQVELLDDARAFWGTYTPQPKWSEPKYNLKDIRERKAKEREVAGGAVMFDVLGGLEAWQLYIPNLRDKDIKRSSVISAHDMTALGMALGLI